MALHLLCFLLIDIRVRCVAVFHHSFKKSHEIRIRIVTLVVGVSLDAVGHRVADGSAVLVDRDVYRFTHLACLERIEVEDQLYLCLIIPFPPEAPIAMRSPGLNKLFSMITLCISSSNTV